MSSVVQKLGRFLFCPAIRFAYLTELGFMNHMSDEAFTLREYRYRTGKTLNLKNPQTFNEKLQWLKVHDHNPEYTKMVDKYAAKQYAAEKIGADHIIPALGVWSTFDEIDFDALPEQFVLKCTHDSGGLVICRDKTQFDKAAARRKIEKYLKRKYFYEHREWPYKDVQPQILAEQYMQDGDQKSLVDYKFYCFNGVPRYLYVSRGMENHATAQIGFLNLEWTFAPFGRTDYRPLSELPPKPQRYEEMLEFARKFSEGIPFLRVDLYEINGKVYFGELTFTPCAGAMPFDPPQADLEVGRLLDISGRMQ